MTTKAELVADFLEVGRVPAEKIASSGEFMTTVIFSAGQLRAAKIFAHARLTVITESARPRLHFSTNLNNRTLLAVGGRPKIVCINSGIGS
jgi:hypothetical protein